MLPGKTAFIHSALDCTRDESLLWLHLGVQQRPFLDYFVLGGMLTVVHRSDCLARVGGKAESGAAKSLHTLIESDAYPDIDWRIKLCGGNVNREGFALSLP